MSTTVAGTVRKRLATAGIDVPSVSTPTSNYLPIRRYGELIFSSGVTSEGITGTAGAGATLVRAREAARLCVTRQLAYLEQEIGTLDLVSSVIRLTGYVACILGFPDTPQVMDAGSDVLVAAFGDAGRHTRSAIGVNGLPGGALVETELIVTLSSPAGEKGLT